MNRERHAVRNQRTGAYLAAHPSIAHEETMDEAEAVAWRAKDEAEQWAADVAVDRGQWRAELVTRDVDEDPPEEPGE